MRTSASSALSILSFTVDHRTLQEDHPLQGAFVDCLEGAALEFLEAGSRETHNGLTMALEVDTSMAPSRAWSVWIEDCEGAPLRHQMQWPRGDRGQIHAAMDHGIARSILTTRQHFHAARVQLRADVSAISAHQKLALAQTRKRMIEALTRCEDAFKQSPEEPVHP